MTEPDRPPIFIRAYRGEDWVALCDIHDAARPQEVAGTMPPGTSAPLTQAAVDEDLFDSDIFVACEGEVFGPVVGFVAIARDMLSWLYVRPDRQGRGIGRELVEAVLPLLGPNGYLTCIASNTPAAAFYERMGFTVAAVFPGDCEGYTCGVLRFCLPESRHRERPPRPSASALRLAGYGDGNPGHAARDGVGVWRWVA